jgi:hypothetical protein
MRPTGSLEQSLLVCNTLKFSISGFELREQLNNDFLIILKLFNIYFLYREFSIGKILCLIF